MPNTVGHVDDEGEPWLPRLLIVLACLPAQLGMVNVHNLTTFPLVGL